MKGVLSFIKLLVKYGAVVLIIVDILNYSVEKFEKMDSKKTNTKSKTEVE